MESKVSTILIMIIFFFCKKKSHFVLFLLDLVVCIAHDLENR